MHYRRELMLHCRQPPCSDARVSNSRTCGLLNGIDWNERVTNLQVCTISRHLHGSVGPFALLLMAVWSDATYTSQSRESCDLKRLTLGLYGLGCVPAPVQ